MLAVRHPPACWTMYELTPRATSRDANVCRRSWNRKSASPAAFTAGCQYRLKFAPRLRPSGVQNTSGETTERRLAALSALGPGPRVTVDLAAFLAAQGGGTRLQVPPDCAGSVPGTQRRRHCFPGRRARGSAFVSGGRWAVRPSTAEAAPPPGTGAPRDPNRHAAPPDTIFTFGAARRGSSSAPK